MSDFCFEDSVGKVAGRDFHLHQQLVNCPRKAECKRRRLTMRLHDWGVSSGLTWLVFWLLSMAQMTNAAEVSKSVNVDAFTTRKAFVAQVDSEIRRSMGVAPSGELRAYNQQSKRWEDVAISGQRLKDSSVLASRFCGDMAIHAHAWWQAVLSRNAENVKFEEGRVAEYRKACLGE